MSPRGLNMTFRSDMKARIALITAVVLAAAGLSAAQTPATTADGKRVILNADGTWRPAPPADPGTPAVLYVYRLKEPGLYNRGTPLMLDGKQILEIKQGDFVGLQLPAGTHRIRTNKDDSEITVTLEPGGKSYAYLVVAYGGFSQTHVIKEVPAAQAVLDMKKTKPIDEKQLRDRSIAIVKEN